MKETFTMNRNIWIISDTHFLHANMLKFLGDDGLPFRGKHFANQDECDELMIENWNKVVKPEDHVWHLGDVFIGNKERFCELWPRLMGHKRLIVGNHDDIRFLSGKNPLTGEWFFGKVELWRYMDDMLLTHVPMQLVNTFEGEKRVTFNVHGHIHNNRAPTLRHYNACVEVNDWAPIHYEDLRKWLRKRKSSL